MKPLLTLTLLLFTGALLAQNPASKPDQVKLLKQFAGTWKADVGKDTVALAEYKSFGTGLEGSARVVANGKIIKEMRQLFGYDSQTDTFIEAEITKGSDIELWACWFTKDNFMTGVPIADRLHPEKAVWRVDILIKSPTQYVQTIYKDGKVVAGKTMNRQ